MTQETLDLFVTGGGVNGCGIARDAAGRGYSVALAEAGDLAQGTSSASTKLIHGGLRYLEQARFRLVRKSLAEREILLGIMPHISRPVRFVLPCHPDIPGQRPPWMIRLGLFVYDHLGARKSLPPSLALDLRTAPEGAPLKPGFRRGYAYSDCQVDDSRLVILNARDAAARGARIMTRARVVSARASGGLWTITVCLRDGATASFRARAFVNAAGPWAGRVIRDCLGDGMPGRLRLVRGSHIVTRRLYDHDGCYLFQERDGRVVFAIPWEHDFTIIGTTDETHGDDPEGAFCTDQAQDYLCRAVSAYLARPVTPGDVVWRYAGVRPLYDDGSGPAAAASRDHALTIDSRDGALLVNVFGGKITTYRQLALEVMARLAPFFRGKKGDWTAGAPLPGGDFPADGMAGLVADLKRACPFLDSFHALRLVRAYGTEARHVLGDATTAHACGKNFGATLTAREVTWLMRHEFAQTAGDVVWRRSKLGLRMEPGEIRALDAWMRERQDGRNSPGTLPGPPPSPL